MKDCNDCYFNERAELDLEPGELCYCKWHGTFSRRACSSWVCETSVEQGENELDGVEEDVWVSGIPELDQSIDKQLDTLTRMNHDEV